jgi:hypothetical protein
MTCFGLSPANVEATQQGGKSSKISYLRGGARRNRTDDRFAMSLQLFSFYFSMGYKREDILETAGKFSRQFVRLRFGGSVEGEV